MERRQTHEFMRPSLISIINQRQPNNTNNHFHSISFWKHSRNLCSFRVFRFVCRPLNRYSRRQQRRVFQVKERLHSEISLWVAMALLPQFLSTRLRSNQANLRQLKRFNIIFEKLNGSPRSNNNMKVRIKWLDGFGANLDFGHVAFHWNNQTVSDAHVGCHLWSRNDFFGK